jgi:hypothetical protein
MNLREAKHWALRRVELCRARWASAADALRAVQSDKTWSPITEVRNEVRRLCGDKPRRRTEIAKVEGRQIRTLPGSYETIGSVAVQVANMARYQRPTTTSDHQARLERQTTRTCARQGASLQPRRADWVIVGDLRRSRSRFRALGTRRRCT